MAITFERFPTDLAEVGPPLLVPAGNVPQQRPLLCEALITELAAEGTLPSVGPVVLVQARCHWQGERGGEPPVSGAAHAPVAGLRYEPCRSKDCTRAVRSVCARLVRKA